MTSTDTPPLPPDIPSRIYTLLPEDAPERETIVITTAHAAKLMGVSRQSINRWILDGKLKAVRDYEEHAKIDYVFIEELWALVPKYLRSGR